VSSRWIFRNNTIAAILFALANGQHPASSNGNGWWKRAFFVSSFGASAKLMQVKEVSADNRITSRRQEFIGE
jgi:hypothetical protein